MLRENWWVLLLGQKIFADIKKLARKRAIYDLKSAAFSFAFYYYEDKDKNRPVHNSANFHNRFGSIICERHRKFQDAEKFGGGEISVADGEYCLKDIARK